MPNAIAFVDAGFLVASLQRNSPTPHRVRVDSARLVEFMTRTAKNTSLLRTYWYDAQWEGRDPRFADREKFLVALSLREGLQLRLGRLQERPVNLPTPLVRALTEMGVDLEELRQRTTGLKEVQQKGVDTLLALDLVTLANNHAYDTAVVFAGDADFAEAIRLAGSAGRRVILVTPPQEYYSVSRELFHVADKVVRLTESQLRQLEFIREPASDRDRSPAAGEGVAPLPEPRPGSGAQVEGAETSAGESDLADAA